MKVDVFLSLSTRQQHTLLMAKLLRDDLERFHQANLLNPQMKELNQLIRYSLYDAIALIGSAAKDPKEAEVFGGLVTAIPDFWEIPGRDPDPTDRAA